MGSFWYDLKKSNNDEQILCMILMEEGYSDVFRNNSTDYNILKTYDIKFKENNTSYTAELKTDYLYKYTGNVAVEISCSNKPSGLSFSKSDFWFYLLGDTYYLINPQALKVFIYDNKDTLKVVFGGDNKNSKLVLIPVDQFIGLSTKNYIDNISSSFKVIEDDDNLPALKINNNNKKRRI